MLAVVFVFAAVAANPVAADQLTVMWDPSSDASVAGYVVYVGTEPGRYVSGYDVGNTTGFTYPPATPGQRYYFAVASYASSGLIGPLSPEVSAATNSPPVLTNPGPQITTVGTAVQLQLLGSDPDGKPVTFGATGLPPGLTATAGGMIGGTPTLADTYLVTATVTDGVLSAAETFTWTVAAPATDSVAPLLEITIPTDGDSYATDQVFVTLGGIARDDGAVAEVVWSTDRGASGRATGTENWIAGVPLQRGPNTITVRARDAAGNVSSRAIVVKSSGKPK